MKRVYLLLVSAALFASCNSEPTLQKYFVEKSEDTSFVAVDISPSILKVDPVKMSAEQKAALDSFDKMNILAFKAAEDTVRYKAERDAVKALLKDEKYQQLMKFGSGGSGGSLSFVGDPEHVEEFILFAGQKETGFAVVRILGKDMNPTGVMTLMQMVSESGIDSEQLKPLKEVFGNKMN